MSKVIDITDKLTFEENPRIRVNGTEIELNADALNMVEIIKASENATAAEMAELFLTKLLATAEDAEKVRALNLNFKGMRTLFTECIKIITGSDDEGEAVTPATT